MTIESQPSPGASERPRAIFSTEDFQILRDALSRYVQAEDVRNADNIRSVLSLYHRLGRLS